ncbi:hypothetical protein DIPPA_10169 [Diplonema papillatum]|nr:hypothetical protein DIPPA_10169 [Diplonema papillatum]
MSRAWDPHQGLVEPMESVAHAALREEYLAVEGGARAAALESRSRADDLRNHAEATALAVDSVRRTIPGTAARAAMQKHSADWAGQHEAGTRLVHSHAVEQARRTANAAGAEADRYNAAAAGFVTAEAELLASHTITHLAGQTAADRAAVAQALAREAKALDACRDTHRTELAIKRSKYVQSSSAAEQTHAKLRALTLLADEAAAHAGETRRRADETGAAVADAAQMHAEIAEAARASTRRAKEAAAAEKEACERLRQAGAAADELRVRAAKARAEAFAAEKHAKARSLAHGAAEADALAAERKAAAHSGRADEAQRRLGAAGRQLQHAAAQAASAEERAARAKAGLAESQLAAGRAEAYRAVANVTYQHADAVKAASEAEHQRACSVEESARREHEHAFAHASIQRDRHCADVELLAQSDARAALSAAAEHSARAASEEAHVEAHVAHRRAASSPHDFTPRKVTFLAPIAVSPSPGSPFSVPYASPSPVVPRYDYRLRSAIRRC